MICEKCERNLENIFTGVYEGGVWICEHCGIVLVDNGPGEVEVYTLIAKKKHVVNALNKALAILKRAYDVSPTGSTVEREVMSAERLLKKLIEEL